MDAVWAWLVAREPLVAEDAVTNTFAVQTEINVHKLPLDSVWAWLVAREPLVAEEVVADTYAEHTKSRT